MQPYGVCMCLAVLACTSDGKMVRNAKMRRNHRNVEVQTVQQLQ